MSEADEFDPRERGLLLGHAWARTAAERGLSLTDGETVVVPESVRQQAMDAVREHLDASDDPDAESAFWDGFNHGMRAYIAEIQTGMGPN